MTSLSGCLLVAIATLDKSWGPQPQELLQGKNPWHLEYLTISIRGWFNFALRDKTKHSVQNFVVFRENADFNHPERSHQSHQCVALYWNLDQSPWYFVAVNCISFSVHCVKKNPCKCQFSKWHLAVSFIICVLFHAELGNVYIHHLWHKAACIYFCAYLAIALRDDISLVLPWKSGD